MARLAAPCVAVDGAVRGAVGRGTARALGGDRSASREETDVSITSAPDVIRAFAGVWPVTLFAVFRLLCRWTTD